MIDSELASPYVAAPAPAMTEVCAKPAKRGPPPGSSPKSKTYDFTAIEIPVVGYGPRIREMPPLARPRSPSALANLVRERRAALHDCYRWARWKRHDLAGTMTLTLELDHFGSVSKVDVADRARWGALATCVADALPAASARSFVPRPTRLTTSITFELSGQAVPARRPGRPAGLTRTPPAGCVLAPADATVDAVTWASPLIKVDDFDQAQDDRERMEAECKASGVRRCRISPIIRDWVSSPSIATGDVDKSIIRSHVKYNLGAFSACFVAAQARTPAPGGEIKLIAELRPDGTSTVSVESSQSGDAALDECVRTAMAEVRFPAALAGPAVIVYMPFAAAAATPVVPAVAPRDTIANIEAAAKAALEAGDAATALRRYVALAKGDPSCQRQVDVVRAMAALRPWIDEPVMAAAADLLALAPTGECLAEALPVLTNLAVRPHSIGAKTQNAELLEIAVERYQLILQANLADTETVRAFLANALIQLGRKDEATALGIEAAHPKLQ